MEDGDANLVRKKHLTRKVGGTDEEPLSVDDLSRTNGKDIDALKMVSPQLTKRWTLSLVVSKLAPS